MGQHIKKLNGEVHQVRIAEIESLNYPVSEAISFTMQEFMAMLSQGEDDGDVDKDSDDMDDEVADRRLGLQITTLTLTDSCYSKETIIPEPLPYFHAGQDSVHHNMGLNPLEAQHNLGTDSLGLPQQMCPEDPNSTQLITASKK
ncbi:hypothetical protein NC652_015565 [Populus alba x Populus x berolinensis]|nr:hypothetical protein NC652_015565 [Populus alba x Populus x berolinensis]